MPTTTCSSSREACPARRAATSSSARRSRPSASRSRRSRSPRPRGRSNGARTPQSDTMQLDVVNSQNEKVGTVDVRDEVFGGRVKSDLIWESVVRANAAERRGTHATKSRALVSGSGKKPWRQKGTGRARVGEIRNPLWRKGGTVFGPRPRSYEAPLPKKMFRAALKSALAKKLQENQLNVIEAFALDSHKTKAFSQALM